MRHGSRARHALTLAAVWVALGGAALPEAGTVDITVTGLRSAKGQVLVCLTREADRFPNCKGSATARTAKMPATTRAVSFDHLPQGRYAVSVLHDENANGRADRTLGMIPREGFGFSRDAPVRMGPPKFDQAAFELGRAGSAQTIRMRYLL